ncbi:MAG: replication-associated recombination protein A [Candidatus Zixiibacteriota bacterium]|nr:MAG: replication-associated recombination protein A [candidate division Zixibacteria bacterium]
MGLFQGETKVPLADRIRPSTLNDFVGQEKILGPETPFRKAIEEDRVGSIILWGPPGTGKTTIARLIAKNSKARFVPFSAVTSGVKDIRNIIAEAKSYGQDGMILFIDEIHRFNKAQQDAFLPHVEKGTIKLIGATTENPSFEVIGPLLSRCRVYMLEPLSPDNLVTILNRALTDKENGLGDLELSITEDALHQIIQLSGGDARQCLNLLEFCAETVSESGKKEIDMALVTEASQRKTLLYDKSGEEHFNLISALHKSMRASDVDASLYWLARMLDAGEDPRYIVRRVIRFAVEDVGLADPRAIQLALAAKDTYLFLGSPEGELAIVQAVIYLALAPKSNSAYMALKKTQDTVKDKPAYQVPMQIRNAPTSYMKAWGYGEGYRYAHDFEDAFAYMECLPDELIGSRFYFPTDRGMEAKLKEKLEWWLERMKKGRKK